MADESKTPLSPETKLDAPAPPPAAPPESQSISIVGTKSQPYPVRIRPASFKLQLRLTLIEDELP
jgi:hypothetical protein